MLANVTWFQYVTITDTAKSTKRINANTRVPKNTYPVHTTWAWAISQKLQWIWNSAVYMHNSEAVVAQELKHSL